MQNMAFRNPIVKQISVPDGAGGRSLNGGDSTDNRIGYGYWSFVNQLAFAGVSFYTNKMWSRDYEKFHRK